MATPAISLSTAEVGILAGLGLFVLASRANAGNRRHLSLSERLYERHMSDDGGVREQLEAARRWRPPRESVDSSVSSEALLMEGAPHLHAARMHKAGYNNLFDREHSFLPIVVWD